MGKNRLEKCDAKRRAMGSRVLLRLPLTLLACLPATAEDFSFFEARIRPILAEHCYSCHGTETQRAELRLDHGSLLLKGGENGPAIVPGDPATSRLMRGIRYEDINFQMPPRGKLPEEAIADIEAWIASGAPWPDEPLPEARGAAPAFDVQRLKSEHWAWQPIQAYPPPTLDSDWPRSDIDRFVLEKLNEHDLTPNAPADKAALLRRVHLDLTGLPPSPEAVTAFLADDAPDAYERVVDGLLASPHFGEQWGRHWLDVTRYAETYGYELDFVVPHAWQYRDYVIRALNADVPYDQFVVEHLAGDLLDEPRMHPKQGFNESIIGTGVWYMHQTQHSPVDVRKDNGDRLENQIDVMGKAFMAMTISCSRCHDHKFDAISQADYYAFAGMLNSTHRDLPWLDQHGQRTAAVEQLRASHGRASETLAAELEELLDASPKVEVLLAANPAPEGDVTALGLPEDAVLFEDFSSSFGAWRAAGDAFGDGPTGALAWMPQGQGARVVPAGVVHSGLESGKLRGRLRSPTFITQHEHIWIRAAGTDGQVRVIVEGYTLRENTDLLWGPTFRDVKHGDDYRWIVISGLDKRQGCRAHIEILDDTDGYLAVDAVYFSNTPPYENEPTPTAAQVVPAADAAYARWTAGRATESDAVALTEAIAAHDVIRTLSPLRAAVRASTEELPAPMRVLAMTDGSSVDEPLHIRGNHRTLGEPVPRRFLEAIEGPEPAPFGEGSGRLELARRMVAPDNPPPARVMVNRVWLHLFGQGIVPSVDNFGLLGIAPTHPELLDYLAARFRDEGWSLKGLIRELVLTETYRMSSHPGNADAEERDPTNKWLHRMPIRRVPAEVLRDSILAVSGSLDATQFGPSIPAYLSDHMGGGHRRPAESGPLDGAGRRSIYLEVRRNFLLPMLLTFDFPPPDTTHGQRSVSNTPAQSLVLMNDPFVAEQAALWAQRTLEQEDATVEARIERLYLRAFGRPATESERALAAAFVTEVRTDLGLDEAAAWNDARVWTALCHSLFMLKEFAFIG